MYRVVRSPTWRAILDTTADLRELPRQIVRDAGLEDAVNEVKATANQVKSEMGATTAEINAEMKAASNEMTSEMRVAVNTAQAGAAEAQATVAESMDAAALAAGADGEALPPSADGEAPGDGQLAANLNSSLISIPVLNTGENEAPVPFSPGETAEQPIWPEQALADYHPPSTEPGELAAAMQDTEVAAPQGDAEASSPPRGCRSVGAVPPGDAEASIPQGDAEASIPQGDAEASIPPILFARHRSIFHCHGK